MGEGKTGKQAIDTVVFWYIIAHNPLLVMMRTRGGEKDDSEREFRKRLPQDRCYEHDQGDIKGETGRGACLVNRPYLIRITRHRRDNDAVL